MGAFSGSDEVTVGTSVSRVVKDAQMPSSLKTGAIVALMSGEDLVDHVLENIAGSIGVKAERMYSYGKKDYVYGLPMGQVRSPQEGRIASHTVIEYEEQKDVEIGYYQYGPLNHLHYGWMKLQQDYGYNSVTNELVSLSAAQGKTVYLHDMVAVVTEASHVEIANGSLDQWGVAPNAGATPYRTALPGLRSPTVYVVDQAAVADYIRVTYSYLTTSWQYITLIIPMTGYLLGSDYFQVGYTYSTPGGPKRGYWLYLSGSGLHPQLDTIFNGLPTQLGSFFPFGYLRFNKQSPASDKTSVNYKSSKKLFDFLGVDFAAMVAGVDANPSIDNVTQALVVMAVPANTTNPLELRYLYDFFKAAFIEASGVSTSLVSDNALQGIAGLFNQEASGGAFVIQDKRFKILLSFDSINRVRKPGVIGVVGAHGSSYATRSLTTYYTIEDAKGRTWQKATITTLHDHFFKKQVSSNIYDEFWVSNLRLKYFIEDDLYTIGKGDAGNLLIPLDRSITQYYSVPDKEILYSRSLHYVINSKVVTHVEWYQSTVFEFIVLVVSVAVVIASLGSAMPGLIAAASAGGGALAIAVVCMVLDALLLQFAFKLFVKAVGPNVAIFVALAAAVMGMYHVIEAGGFAGAPFAKDMLMLSSGLSSGISAVLKDLVSGITADYGALTELYSNKSKLLDAADDLLNSKNNLLSPFVLFGESPTDYYQRSVHQGNIGVLGITMVSSYVDIALTLPKLQETTGEEFNGN